MANALNDALQGAVTTGNASAANRVATISDVTGAAPAAHATSHQNGGSDEISVAGLSGLLADGQTPLAHATSHKLGGSDMILLNEFGNPTGSVQFSQQQALQFVIENRTSDPGAPVAGSVWLRTDL